MKIYLDMIGCRLNQAEIEQYAMQFRAAGHTLVGSAEDADLAVVNTCSVTSAAESDSRQKIRQAHRAGVEKLVVTGCYATLKPDEALSLPGVQQVIRNQDKDQLVGKLLNLQSDPYNLEPIQRQPLPGNRMRTRAFIKVQDGCDNRCTFCITTLARGEGRSRTIPEVLKDIQYAMGEYSGNPEEDEDRSYEAKEIVLTGVHLGSWGQDLSPRLSLVDLVGEILKQSNVKRLRLSSLEPWDLDDSFFSLWEDPRLCRHLHLPLQSGSGSTLRRMARKTTPEAYARLVDSARKSIPDVAITTDIITGFPGESEVEFVESLEFIQAMHFADGHVFTYSARPGTAAARMPGQAAHSVRKERNARVREILRQSNLVYRSGFIGKVLPVLWESISGLGPDGWELSGLTDNYLRVSTNSSHQENSPILHPLWNTITPTRLVNLTESGLKGLL